MCFNPSKYQVLHYRKVKPSNTKYILYNEELKSVPTASNLWSPLRTTSHSPHILPSLQKGNSKFRLPEKKKSIPQLGYETYSCADPERGQGVWAPLKIHKVIRFLSNTGLDRQKKSFQASIYCLAIVGPPAKRHFNGVLLADR